MNINEYRNRFYNLLESKLGNVKPLICEIEIGEDKIDLSQTYLSPEKMKELKDTNKTNPDPYLPSVKVKKVSDIKGNQFKDAGLISGNEYGITFEEITKNVYKVNFPNEFIQKYFSLPTSQVYDSQLGPYGDEHGNKDVPMNADKYVNTLSGPIAMEYSIEDSLNNININTEGHPTNRIHFPSGVPRSLRGSGLGYIIYESFIKYLGWGSSQPNASSLAQVIWSKLAEDPDFYSFVIEMNNDTSIFTISKKSDLKPDNIVNSILYHFKGGGNVKLTLGDDLKNDYPNLVVASENPINARFNLFFDALKYHLDYLISLKGNVSPEFTDGFYNGMLRKTNEVMDILYSEDYPYPLYRHIYDEVKSLFDKVIDLYYISSSVSFQADNPDISKNIPKWKRKGKNGQELVLDSTTLSDEKKWTDGSLYVENFESALSAAATFFNNFFDRQVD
jgi:hypothetical protein